MTKSIFITGAASGIGKATAKLFAERGYFVGLYDVDEKGLAALHAELGQTNSCHGVLDVTDLEAFRRSVAAFESATGTMHVLFNCAGILRMGRFEEIPPAEAAKEVQINVMGVIHGIYAALPLLEKTTGACILNMSSASAIYGTPELAVYSATKFAVRALTEALDLEFRKKGIRVADIMPGYVDTPMVSDQTHRAKSLKTMGVKLKPQDIAKLVWRAAHGKRLHNMAKADLEIFVRLAGFEALARPAMRMISKM